ncbi:MAG: hypothetical protein DCC68_13110 [Planctomycetota bacterium]|nr:MAG: hypothetical protein DCC68_13110 [Planctomycetota bacterium]
MRRCLARWRPTPSRLNTPAASYTFADVAETMGVSPAPFHVHRWARVKRRPRKQSRATEARIG